MNNSTPTPTFQPLVMPATPAFSSLLPGNLAPGGDPARQAIQSHLYYTQFYKGRTDGHPDDERMDTAIKLVQIAAHLLPVTGIFDNDVRDAIVRFRENQSFLTYPEAFAEGALKDPTQIAWAQRALAALGYYPKTGPFDGEARATLVDSFRAFERANPIDDNRFWWLPTENTVQEVRKALAVKGFSPDAPGPAPVGAMPPQRGLARDLATFAILTSPAWGLLLLIKRPWTKLSFLRSARLTSRARGR